MDGSEGGDGEEGFSGWLVRGSREGKRERKGLEEGFSREVL
jgi:hypothetical protein